MGSARLPRPIRLAGVALLGLGSLAVLGPGSAPAEEQPGPCGPSPVPAFFSDDAPGLPVAEPDERGDYTLTAHVGAHSFHSGWPAVRTLGYSAPGAPMDYLGPTIVTREGTPTAVKVVNALPPAGVRVFPFDQPDNENTTTLHRHGGLQAPVDDGVPAPLQEQTPPGGSRVLHYPNTQAASPLWYHDHPDMNASYHVYEGLAGYIPNTDPLERTYGLPSGDFAKTFIVQDKSFNRDFTLCYGHTRPQFFGDLPVVNGTIAPKQQVEPRRYTFTLINGSDSRFYRFGFKQVCGRPSNAPRMTVVAGDNGYVLHPAPVTDLVVAPGERYKLVVDFTGHQSENWVLSNTAPIPFPGRFSDGVDPEGGRISQVMRFDVGSSVSSPDTSRVPATLAETNNSPPASALLAGARLRTVQGAEAGRGSPQLGDRDRVLDYSDPVTETPEYGTTEAWAFRNRTGDAHPIHEHLVELRLVGRWHVGRWDAGGNPVPSTIGPFEPAAAFESGPKDTFITPPDSITVWVGRYTVPGTAVWHCHIMSHEDGAASGGEVEMMRPLSVVSAPQLQLPFVVNLQRLDQLVRQP
ncbi:multicopper oxidase family protein [Amycolatopsis pigmentata]|uniref:Multicopper oxidase family protein n=1 Tax=Amycolatopsis pigmentata TaxID=450801 RepID=A0ABW5FQ73_9PSEU